VGIWDQIWSRNKKQKSVLEYDVLIAPHHCSWHSLSWDSWSDCGEKAKVSPDAKSALGQAKSNARVLASSKPVVDDDSDPPCIWAKREYESILKLVSGKFYCIADGDGDAPYELEITTGAVNPAKGKSSASLLKPATAAVGAFAFPKRTWSVLARKRPLSPRSRKIATGFLTLTGELALTATCL
jgi:hypothetical protein